MSRRANLERLHDARRAGIRYRLARQGMSQELADRWVAAWEAEATALGLAHDDAFWDAGWAWIAEQSAVRRRGP